MQSNFVEQDLLLPRKLRRPKMVRLAKQKRKLERRLQGINIQVEFDNRTTTGFGNFFAIESFKEAIGFREILKKHFSLTKAPNSKYSALTTLESLIDCCCLGLSRFEHTQALRYDPGYKALKDITDFPAEKVYRDFLGNFILQHIQELVAINQEIIQLKSHQGGPREVWLDFDDTVITLHGHQEEGEIGYNPRYHGRPSIKVKVGFIHGTDELLYAGRYGGKTHSNDQFLEFFNQTVGYLPHNYVLKGARLDKGFFDEKNFAFLESQYLEYICKAPLYPNLRWAIQQIPEKDWQIIDDYHSVIDRSFILNSWEKPRRFCIRRILIDKDTQQMTLPHQDFYRYEAVVTSMEAPPEEVLSRYDKGANVENKIDELKDGFAVKEASQHEKLRNLAYMWIKILAYNLMNWFRQTILPEDKAHCEIKTIRREIINVPGNILGKGRFRRVRLAFNQKLEQIIRVIKEKLDQFLWFVANGFKPLKC